MLNMSVRLRKKILFVSEQEVTLDALLVLSAEHISELVPIVGHRAILQAQLKALKEGIGGSQEVPIQVSFSLKNITLHAICMYRYRRGFFFQNIEILPRNESGDMSFELHNTSLSFLALDGQPGTSSSVLHESQGESEVDLRTYLASINEGKGLLLQYELSGLLDNTGRRKLCNIVINKELQGNPNAKISSQSFYQLAYDITKVFKRESAPVYFTPFVCISPTQKSAAKGKLLDLYRQRRREFVKSGLITTRKRSISTNSPSTSCPGSPLPPYVPASIISDATTNLPEPTPETAESVETYTLWLKNSCHPWITVEVYWEHTRKARLQKFANSQMTISEYFGEFKALEQQAGQFLVRIPFLLKSSLALL